MEQICWGKREGQQGGSGWGRGTQQARVGKLAPARPLLEAGRPAAASSLEQPLTHSVPGAPLPFPTFRVVEETQGGGGDEGVHGLPARPLPLPEPPLPLVARRPAGVPLPTHSCLFSPPPEASPWPSPKAQSGAFASHCRSSLSVAPSALPKLPGGLARKFLTDVYLPGSPLAVSQPHLEHVGLCTLTFALHLLLLQNPPPQIEI